MFCTHLWAVACSAVVAHGARHLAADAAWRAAETGADGAQARGPGTIRGRSGILDWEGTHTWLCRLSTDERSQGRAAWQPLRRSDQPRLESAEAARRAGEASDDAVAIDGGRAEVRLSERIWAERYGGDPPTANRPVRRALWFRTLTEGREPYEEEDDRRIEEAFQSLREHARELKAMGVVAEAAAGAEPMREVVLSGNRRTVNLTLKRTTGADAAKAFWKLVAEERPLQDPSWWLKSAQIALLGKVFGVTRGYGEIEWLPGEQEEELMSPKVRNVMVLVHGIGEKLWSEGGSGLAAQSSVFRRNLHASQLRSYGFVRKGSSWEPPAGNVTTEFYKDEVLEASWWQDVHKDDSVDRLGRITLPSMPQVREFANFALLDAMYFMQAASRGGIACSVATAVMRAVRRFRRHHPDHEGAMALIGHSLGGAILFELLRGQGDGGGTLGPDCPRLDFVPRFLFTLGSPTGLFLHCGDTVPDPGFSLPGGVRFFNIFHPMDPVAYRIEPLFAAGLNSEAPPARVPAAGAWGGLKMSHAANSMVRWATGKDRKSQQAFEEVKLALNAGDRIDWALQEDLSIMGVAGVAGDLINGLQSHGCYLVSPDVAEFIQARVSASSAADPGGNVSAAAGADGRGPVPSAAVSDAAGSASAAAGGDGQFPVLAPASLC